MTAHLTSTCACGRSISIKCPTVADIPAAQAKMAGWGYDDKGHVRCPDHLGKPEPVQAPPPEPQQGTLL